MTLAQLISRHASAKRQTPSSSNNNLATTPSPAPAPATNATPTSAPAPFASLAKTGTNAQLVPGLVPRTINVSLLIKCAIYNIFLCGSRATRNRKPTANAYAKKISGPRRVLQVYTARKQRKGCCTFDRLLKIYICRYSKNRKCKQPILIFIKFPHMIVIQERL